MDLQQTPLCPYFEKLPSIGKEFSKGEKERLADNVEVFQEEEKRLNEAVAVVKATGTPVEKIHKRGQMTAYERIEYLVEPGSWNPLHTLYNPMDNEEGCTGVVDGLGKIAGKWAVVIAFDNKIMAGAWIGGQSENILRVTDLAKRLNIPLVWLTNCSGVKLMEQEKVYANRRGSGTPFFRHAELNVQGIPVLNGIYGTNPAGGGYQGISPTVLVAHKDANIAVGGAGIVGGMSPRGHFDLEGAYQIIEAMKSFKGTPPGRVDIHYHETAFFREVYDAETGVLDALKNYMRGTPSYDPIFFRVAKPQEPALPINDIYYALRADQKKPYDALQVLARLTDGSEFQEFRPDYGPEMFTGLAKISGFPVGIIGNRQGIFPNYPEYNPSYGVGGKLYRQGLIKMSEFVTHCWRDNIPIIWLQDTTGIDVGDPAEKAELLGLGQSLIYSIEKSGLPMMCVVLRKGTAAAHYVLGGPQANENTAFTLGTMATEIYVMHGETAAVAAYSRRLAKENEAGRPLEPVIAKMNEMVEAYYEKSRPLYCARTGFVDEIVKLSALRSYCVAFTECCYQNPRSITPVHQMLLPRLMKG